MLSPEKIKMYNQKIVSIRFPATKDKPYKIIYIPENCDIIDVYEKLNLHKVDFKIYCNPRFKLGGSYKTGDKVLTEKIRMRGLPSVPRIEQVDRMQKNSVIDLSSFSKSLKDFVGNNFNTPRSESLYNDAVDDFCIDKNFYNCLVYITDTRIPLSDKISDRLSWLYYYHYLKNKEPIPYINSMFAGVINNSGQIFYRKMFDKNEEPQPSKYLSIMKTIKRSKKK